MKPSGLVEVSVQELQPGDVIHLAGRTATYLAQSDHPIFPGLRLVVWVLADGLVSLDALSPKQVVGECEATSTAETRSAAARAVLLGNEYRRVPATGRPGVLARSGGC